MSNYKASTSNDKTLPRENDIKNEALAAYDAGLCVLPPKEDGSKAPILPWAEFQHERPSHKQVTAWYGHDRAGLGVLCGLVSGNLECLEAEDLVTYQLWRDTADAAGIGALIGRIEAGYLDKAPRGGRHLLYRCETIGGNTKLASRPTEPGERRHDKDLRRALMETRGEGGYIVCAPSHGNVHPSGRAYERISGGFDTIAKIAPEEREQLHRLARSLDRMPPAEPLPSMGSTRTDDGGDRPGDLYNAQVTWDDILVPHGWTHVFTRGGTSYWRRPGKTEGISATTNRHGSDLLWMFTSSTAFEPDRSYTKFGAYTVLEHNGDFAAAGRELFRLGYKTDKTPGNEFTMNGKTPHGSQGEAGGHPAGMLSLRDFAAYLPEHKYIYLPTGKIWEMAGVNSAFPPIGTGKDAVKQSTFVDQDRPIHDLTWAPGHPQIIKDAFLDQGGWLPKRGARVFNSYRPPLASIGVPAKADPWIDHVDRVYPDNGEHIIQWLAHRVQRPGEKVNHALVLGGAQGIGKDTILEPVKHAIGPWNFADVSPIDLMGRFNSFLKSVIVRVSELRDMGDRDRYGFYEHTKTVIASPPDILLVDEKNIRAYRVPNLVGVIFTTNHRTDGLYLPADDRRHYVAWSDLTASDFQDDYWTTLYRWFDDDDDGGRGTDHVVAFLSTMDISGFDPKSPPPKTSAFFDVVGASRAPEDADMADAIDRIGSPDALTITDILVWRGMGIDYEFNEWLRDRKHVRQIPHRFEAAGYVATRNPERKDGFWVVGGKRQVIYARATMSIRDRIHAAQQRAK